MFVPDSAQPSLVPGSSVAAVAELTATNVSDLVLIDGEEDSIGVMLGNGAGGFGAPTWYELAGKPADDVSVADFNNDGHVDLLVGVQTAPPPTPQGGTTPDKVQILRGDGQGNFTVGQPIALPEVGHVYVGDYTGNGDQDAVVVPDGCTGGSNNKKYYMLLGDGHGDLTPGPVYESPRAGGCSSWVGDFTGDGREDILTQPQSPGEEEALIVLPGELDGSFGAPIVTPTPELAPYAAFVGAVGDLNGDGKLDVVMRAIKQSAGQVVVLDGNGAGGFTPGGFYPLEQPNTYNFDVALSAFAGDGHVDIAAIGSPFQGSQLTLFTNNGAGVFSSVPMAPLAASFGSVFVADVNGDGRPDIILDSQSELHIFLDEPANPPSSGPPTKPIAPSVQRASESAKRWREGSRLAKISRRTSPPVGTTFSFLLDEPAMASFSFTRQLTGRRVHGRCAAKTSKNRRRTRCKRTVTAGALSFAAHAGTNKITFDGRISRSKRLTPGRYTLTIKAANTAGESNAKQLTFTIVK
jgi:FG-GAP-like repeat/FG-GAP repeat